MEKGSLQIQDDLEFKNGFFFHFIQSLALIGDNGSLTNNEAQQEKARRFVSIALDKCCSHFIRWANKQLMPAVLPSEKPSSEALSCVIAGVQPPWEMQLERLANEEEANHCKRLIAWDDVTIFSSKVHTNVQLLEFERWPQDPIDIDTCGALMKRAASLILEGVDARDITSHGAMRQLWSHCLPSLSNTQFVERGVKEAMCVSKTGRKEEQGTACARVRSFNVLCDDFGRETSMAD